jgi:hypothetical protein
LTRLRHVALEDGVDEGALADSRAAGDEDVYMPSLTQGFMKRFLRQGFKVEFVGHQRSPRLERRGEERVIVASTEARVKHGTVGVGSPREALALPELVAGGRVVASDERIAVQDRSGTQTSAKAC